MECLLCGDAAQYCERNNVEHSFCSKQCHETAYQIEGHATLDWLKKARMMRGHTMYMIRYTFALQRGRSIDSLMARWVKLWPNESVQKRWESLMSGIVRRAVDPGSNRQTAIQAAASMRTFLQSIRASNLNEMDEYFRAYITQMRLGNERVALVSARLFGNELNKIYK